MWTEAARSAGSKNFTIENVQAVSSELVPTAESDQKRCRDTCVLAKTTKNPRCYQVTLQRYAVQSKSGVAHQPQSLDAYIQTSVNSGNGEDILKLSCCLGYLSFFGVKAARDNLTVDKIDGCFLYCVGRLRDICKKNEEALFCYLVSCNMREVMKIIAVTSLHLFNPRCRYSEDGDAFVWQIANAGEAAVNSMGVATFCVGIWPFVKEVLVGKEIDIPKISMQQFESRWYIRFYFEKKQGASFVFDVDRVHRFGENERSEHNTDVHTLSGQASCDEQSENALGKLFLVEFVRMESGKSSDEASWIRLVLNWDKKLNTRLCCFLPFVKFLKDFLESACVSSPFLADIPMFLGRHATHTEMDCIDDACRSCLASCQTCCRRKYLGQIASSLDDAGRVCPSSARDVYAASLAVGSSVDALLRRAQGALRTEVPHGSR